jgi:hypothetical protein
MSLPLVSETQGDHGVVNWLAQETWADAIVHAGDFGFWGKGSRWVEAA